MKYLKTYERYIKYKDVVPWLRNRELSKLQFDKMYNDKFSHVDLKNDKPIYRSIHSEEPYLFLRRTKVDRASANAGNHYTLLFNNLPSWNDYPKRTHICSNIKFDFNSVVYRVLPLKDVRIGVLPTDDMHSDFFNLVEGGKFFEPYRIKSFWHVYRFYNNHMDLMTSAHVSTPTGEKRLDDIMEDSAFKEARIKSDSWVEMQISMSSYLNYLNTINISKFTKSKVMKGYFEDFKSMFDINKVNDILDPKKFNILSLSYDEYKNMDLGKNIGEQLHYKSDYMHEIWLDGDLLLIREDLV